MDMLEGKEVIEEEGVTFSMKNDLLLHLFSRNYARLKSFHQLNELNYVETLFHGYSRYRRLGQLAGLGTTLIFCNTIARNWRGFSKILAGGLIIYYSGQLSLYYNIDHLYGPTKMMLKVRHSRSSS